MPTAPPFVLPALLHGRVEAAVASLYGGTGDDFLEPAGEPALTAPDSVSWQVFKNPVTLFIGGIAAVLLELAEPRVRSGVWDHTAFRVRPLERMQRTGRAAAMTVFGPRSRTEAMIARVSRLHGAVAGRTPQGEAYRADDPALLTWVQATAAAGFLDAHAAYVQALPPEARDRYFAEGRPAATLYGAMGAPASQAQYDTLLAAMAPQLGPSEVLHEFLDIVARMPALPAPLRPMQAVYARAAVAILPAALRERLRLTGTLAGWERALVERSARAADRLLLRTSPAVLACRRLGLPDDWLYRRS